MTSSFSLQAGPFFVASVVYHLIDDQRKELYTNDPAHPWRELMVRIWYPVNTMRYPLLIFSHGLGGVFNGDTYAMLCEACVKAGYIVVTISHSYACKPIQFSDGRVTTHSFSPVAQAYLSGREMESWEADSEYVLNQCHKYNRDENSFLYNRIDVHKIGMFGHSYGGSVAIQMCRKDDRVKAAINLDGPLRGKNSMVPFGKPLLFIVGARLPYNFTSMLREVVNDIGWSYCMYSKELSLINSLACCMHSDVYKVVIDGIRHTTFSDEIFSQHTLLDELLIDPVLAQAIISSYVIDFFDVYLKGKESYLLDQVVSPWTQVVVEKMTAT
jgi:dienelactone hydrolase